MSMNPLQMSRVALRREGFVSVTVVAVIAALLAFLNTLVAREITFLAGPESQTPAGGK